MHIPKINRSYLKAKYDMPITCKMLSIPQKMPTLHQYVYGFGGNWNELSSKTTKWSVSLKDTMGETKTYNNIHKPEAYIAKVFRSNANIVHAHILLDGMKTTSFPLSNPQYTEFSGPK